MMKKMLTLCVLLGTAFAVNAQNAKEGYQDFTVYRTTKGDAEHIAKMKKLLQQQEQLSPKQVTNLQYHLGRMHEEIGDAESALVYYEQSLKGEANYTVLRRALGFIYLGKTKPFVKQMNEASAAKNATANANAFSKYKEMVLKALPHLEKYQACEPDEETLTIITNLYKSIKDQQSIASLPSRLKTMEGSCVTLLDDE
ncbi:tetratricopeptide repeat protein [Pedobacter nanyangensis]|uniref:tetratricopeptide repeat protein n=1 Tax=Pedobacter nanyangensis TaxID=1562389 RepID=UPI0013B40F09|nr:hypothetical protein [Pedobacter nanyangensis]